MAKTVGLIFMNIRRAETYVRSPRRGMKMKKKKKSRLWCFSLRGDWALHSVGSPVWSAFHSAPSKVFQCRMLHHTAWSTTHFSAYLYPFKSRDLTNPYAKPSRHTNWLMNNRRKDAARLLRENKRRWTSCLEDFSEMDLDQSSTGSWHSRQKKKKKRKKKLRKHKWSRQQPLWETIWPSDAINYSRHWQSGLHLHCHHQQ